MRYWLKNVKQKVNSDWWMVDREGGNKESRFACPAPVGAKYKKMKKKRQRWLNAAFLIFNSAGGAIHSR